MLKNYSFSLMFLNFHWLEPSFHRIGNCEVERVFCGALIFLSFILPFCKVVETCLMKSCAYEREEFDECLSRFEYFILSHFTLYVSVIFNLFCSLNNYYFSSLLTFFSSTCKKVGRFFSIPLKSILSSTHKTTSLQVLSDIMEFSKRWVWKAKRLYILEISSAVQHSYPQVSRKPLCSFFSAMILSTVSFGNRDMKK